MVKHLSLINYCIVKYNTSLLQLSSSSFYFVGQLRLSKSEFFGMLNFKSSVSQSLQRYFSYFFFLFFVPFYIDLFSLSLINKKIEHEGRCISNKVDLQGRRVYHYNTCNTWGGIYYYQSLYLLFFFLNTWL